MDMRNCDVWICSEFQGKKAADTQDRVLTHFIRLA